ncbi:MAG: hypothetical protein DHS20C07_06850 [Methyloligella sp.]|nr:MAG: hypothetical protein DHS20C07_06850 [Methyloligella sp.]
MINLAAFWPKEREFYIKNISYSCIPCDFSMDVDNFSSTGVTMGLNF